MLFDCGSSNGTFVNGEKITKKTIHPGDMISFGDIQYFFCYAE
jgi:pSer/pThr/pTyr-binding forkhead associated (FHA) protein